MPTIARPRTAPAQPPRDCRSEFQHPIPDGFVGDVEATVGQQFLHVAVDRYPDNTCWPEGPRPSPPRLRGEGSAPSARVGATTPQALPLPDKPSIAVLPFVNLNGDPEQDYFVDGMVEVIITAAIGGNARVFGHIPNLTLLDAIPPGRLPAVTAKGLL